MKKGVGLLFAFSLVVLATYSASAYMLDFSIDNSTYMCGDVAHGVLKVSHYAGEQTDANRVFTINLFAPSTIINGASNCMFDATGRVIPESIGGCNGYGIGLRQIGIIKTGTTRATNGWAATDADGYPPSTNVIVKTNGPGNNKSYGDADIPVGDGIYDIWFDTGAFVSPESGTCALGTYGSRVSVDYTGGNQLSDYRAYDVYTISNLTDGSDDDSLVLDSDVSSTSSSSSSHKKDKKVVNLASSSSSDVSVLSDSDSEDVAVPSLPVEVKSSNIGLLAFFVVVLAGVVLAVYVRMRN